MKDSNFRSFEEFWPYYLREHSKKDTRTLHFIGTTLAMALAAGGLVTRRPALLLAAPVVGYGLSWIGHFFIEHNRPATLEHPLWSFQGDLKMWLLIVTGGLDAEINRTVSSNGVDADNGFASAAPDPQTTN
jgi:hypothetical protein